MSEPTETREQSEAGLDAAEVAAELILAEGRDHQLQAAKLALAFLTRNVAGLGQTHEGDVEAFKRDNVLEHYPDVERAYRVAAKSALGLLASVFDGARRS